MTDYIKRVLKQYEGILLRQEYNFYVKHALVQQKSVMYFSISCDAYQVL